MEFNEYCCYEGNENVICEGTYCDECDCCPDAWFNSEEEEDEN